MKKIQLLIAVVLIAASVQAQQGSWYLGGMAGIGSNNNDGTKMEIMNWNFSPEFGTFLRDDIQLGLALNINGSTTKSDGDETSTGTGFSPVLYARKFWSIGDILSTFAGVNLNYISGSVTNTTYAGGVKTGDETLDRSGFGASLNIGAAVALNDRFAVLTQYGLLGFSSVGNSSDRDGVDDYDVTDWGFNLNTLGPVFNVGLYYTIVPAK